jgi:hypothetical protein
LLQTKTQSSPGYRRLNTRYIGGALAPLTDKQAGITLVCIGFAPSIKARSPDPEIPTCLAHITDLVGMLQNPKFTLYLSLIAVH